jgi:predicted MFS family arabinose efflux permease
VAPGADYRRLWSAGAISHLGDGMHLAALPLLAAEVAHSPLQVSMVVAATWVPWLLFGLVSGAVADRWDRLRIMVVSDATRFGVLVVVAVAVWAQTASIGVILVAAFLLGSAQTAFDSAAQAVIPTVVGRDVARLTRANGQMAASQSIGEELAGPPLGGALFAVSPVLPMILNGMSFLVSAALVGRIRRPPEAGRPRAAGARGLRAEVAQGVRWLLGNPVVLAMVVAVGLSNMAWVGAESVLVLFARDRLGLDAWWFGALLAAPAVGALPGAMLAGVVARRVPVGWVLVGGMLGQSGVLGGIGLAGDPLVVAGLLAMGGLLGTTWNIAQAAQRQVIVPDALMGRVVASGRVFAYGSASVGALLAGLVADRAGVAAPFLAASALIVVATLVVGRYLDSAAVGRARARATRQITDLD